MNNKLLRGASILVPVLFIIFTAAFIILVRQAGPNDQLPSEIVPWLALSVVFLFLSMTSVFFFIIFDIIHICKRRSLSAGAKVGWVCAIWFLNVFAIPVYGVLYYTDDRRSGSAES